MASLGPTDTTRYQNGVNKVAHDTGRLRAILPHPTQGDTVYVLTSGGGLWKTTNFSAQKPTWVPKSDGIEATAGGSAAFGRTPSVLYLGTGDPFDLGVGGTMYKSTDGGDTWSGPVSLPFALTVLDVKVDTSQGSTTASDIVLVGTDVGLYRSIDGGASYAYVGFPVNPTGPYVAGIPGFGPLLGREVWSLAQSSQGWLASVSDYFLCSNCYEFTHFYVSTDRGATWANVTDPYFGNNITFPGRSTLAWDAGEQRGLRADRHLLRRRAGGRVQVHRRRHDLERARRQRRRHAHQSELLQPGSRHHRRAGVVQPHAGR